MGWTKQVKARTNKHGLLHECESCRKDIQKGEVHTVAISDLYEGRAGQSYRNSYRFHNGCWTPEMERIWRTGYADNEIWRILQEASE